MTSASRTRRQSPLGHPAMEYGFEARRKKIDRSNWQNWKNGERRLTIVPRFTRTEQKDGMT